jgi:hypothetical protein
MLPITIETNCDNNHVQLWNQRNIYLDQPNIFLPQARIHILHGIGALKVGSTLWTLHFLLVVCFTFDLWYSTITLNPFNFS